MNAAAIPTGECLVPERPPRPKIHWVRVEDILSAEHHKPVAVEGASSEPDHHEVLHISVSAQDSIVWYSDVFCFRVLTLEPDETACNITNAPAQPFHRQFPSKDYEWQIASGPAVREAIGYTYKMQFQTAEGRLIDPHLIVRK